MAPSEPSGLDTKSFIVKGRRESRSPTGVDPRLASVESVDYDKRGPAIVVTDLRLAREASAARCVTAHRLGNRGVAGFRMRHSPEECFDER